MSDPQLQEDLSTLGPCHSAFEDYDYLWETQSLAEVLLQTLLSVLTLIQSVPPPATAVAHERPWSLCQKCRWQVTPNCTLDPRNSEWADCPAQA